MGKGRGAEGLEHFSQALRACVLQKEEEEDVGPKQRHIRVVGLQMWHNMTVLPLFSLALSLTNTRPRRESILFFLLAHIASLAAVP